MEGEDGMNTAITFPGLGIEWNPNRVAFTILGKEVYWYGIIIAAGFLLAVWFCLKQAKQYGITSDNLIDVLIFAVPLSIIGARIYYIIFYFSLFQTEVDGVLKPDFGKMIAIWDGGLAIYGGIIVAVVTTFVVCKIKKIGFGAFCDLGCFGLLIGQAVGRWGNFINREAFGGETTLPWRMGLYAPDYVEVHPTFLYESLWNVLGFLLLFWFVKKIGRKFDGQIFLMYVIWYGIGRAVIEGLRTDSLYFFGLTFFGMPIRTSQMLAIASCIIAAGILIFQLAVRKHALEDLYVNRVHAQNGMDAPSGTE
jgi:phosphatidylglycerol:prolipoprotein diacylglycerol transferase